MPSTRRIYGASESGATHTNYHSFEDTTTTTSNNIDPLATTVPTVSSAESHPRPSSNNNNSNNNATNRNYRGFSTSMSDLFADPRHERIDCCALTRLATVAGQAPVDARPLADVALFLAGLGAMRIQDVMMNQIISTGLILMLAFYLYLQLSKGRAKRIEIRKDLLYTKYQIQQQASEQGTLAVLLEHQRPYEHDDDDDNGTVERPYYLGQTSRDMRCAHPCCLVGFYAEDRDVNVYHERSDDWCANLFELVCPGFCGMHPQFCGMCALAQEAREIETVLLPPSYRRIDYITMEPVMKYYTAVYQHTHKDPDADEAVSSSTRPHAYTVAGHPLSLLSYRLVRALVVFWIAMLVWSIVGRYYWMYVVGRRANNHHTFQFPDFLLLLATFGQAFAFLAIWRHYTNRTKSSELSMDALIKYFASGFFLSASLALFWELVASLVINTLVSLLLAVSGINSMGSPEGDLARSIVSTPGSSLLTSMSGSLLDDTLFNAKDVTLGKPDYTKIFGLDHPLLYTMYIIVSTFVVAGFVEEISKYFGFRMVEHPDFFTVTELDEASLILRNSRADEDDEDDAPCERGQPHSRTLTDFSKQGLSVQARGAAITLAMVSVALGFTCCENLMYIFCYAGNSVRLELGVLVERTFFPVHPILAAIQSIGVCQRELEASRSTKLGRILAPAVLFHGLFDFAIIFISFVAKLLGAEYEEGDLRISNTAELLSIVSCVSVMFAALAYLYLESGKQRERLIAIDGQATIDRSNLI